MTPKNPVTKPGIDAGIILLLAQRPNHCAIQGPVMSAVLALCHKEAYLLNADAAIKCIMESPDNEIQK
jgi:hypothetical protein